MPKERPSVIMTDGRNNTSNVIVNPSTGDKLKNEDLHSTSDYDPEVAVGSESDNCKEDNIYETPFSVFSKSWKTSIVCITAFISALPLLTNLSYMPALNMISSVCRREDEIANRLNNNVCYMV